jgi:hypothetical protein
LAVSRRADADFTVCVCCKLDAIERRRDRPTYLTAVRRERDQ